MKNYSDLQDTNLKLDLCLTIDPIGCPNIDVVVGNNKLFHGTLNQKLVLKHQVDLTTHFSLSIQLREKLYSLESETAAVIENFSIDGITLIPKFEYLAQYNNDHNRTDPTCYLGFNGRWTLTFDCPFYHWLHKHSGQGWLLT